ncbi:hypothetical protein ABKN59_006282 [Abortiporus biennis]
MLNKRLSYEDLGSGAASRDLTVFLFFQIAAGHVALPILAATFYFSRTASRPLLLINLCITWVMSAICSTLVNYPGQMTFSESTYRPVHQGVCIGQSATMNAIPAMTNIALLTYVIYLWKSTRNAPVIGSSMRRRILLASLLAAPYIVFLVTFIPGEYYGKRHPDRVSLEWVWLYCSIDWTSFQTAMGVLCVLICTVTIALQAHMAYLLLKFKHRIHDNMLVSDIDVDLLVRVAIFTAFQFTATILYLISTFDKSTVLPQMFWASTSMALFVVFASHPSVLRCWLFGWRNSKASKAIQQRLKKSSSSIRSKASALSAGSSTLLDHLTEEYALPKLSHKYSQNGLNQPQSQSEIPPSCRPELNGTRFFESEYGLPSADHEELRRYQEAGLLPSGVEIIRRPEDAFSGDKKKYQVNE